FFRLSPEGPYTSAATEMVCVIFHSCGLSAGFGSVTIMSSSPGIRFSGTSTRAISPRPLLFAAQNRSIEQRIALRQTIDGVGRARAVPPPLPGGPCLPREHPPDNLRKEALRAPLRTGSALGFSNRDPWFAPVGEGLRTV